jgi:hypothetical protein
MVVFLVVIPEGDLLLQFNCAAHQATGVNFRPLPFRAIMPHGKANRRSASKLAPRSQ